MKNKKKQKTLTEELSVGKRLRSKHKKPDFKRQESWRYKRVKENWRRPRGIDSKMRKKVKGWPPSPKAGYRSPKKLRGIHPSGYVEVQVQTVEQVTKVDPEKQTIRIAHSVGAKKRVEILRSAEKRGIRVLNQRRMKEIETFEEEDGGKEI